MSAAAPSWVATSIAIGADDGSEMIAGWRYGSLFIDFRPLMQPDARSVPFCWSVTHVGSGLHVIALLTGIDRARRLVEQLHAVADWDAIAIARDGTAPPAFRQWLSELPCDWCVAADTVPPHAEVEHRPVLRVVK